MRQVGGRTGKKCDSKVVVDVVVKVTVVTVTFPFPLIIQWQCKKKAFQLEAPSIASWSPLDAFKVPFMLVYSRCTLELTLPLQEDRF